MTTHAIAAGTIMDMKCMMDKIENTIISPEAGPSLALADTGSIGTVEGGSSSAIAKKRPVAKKGGKKNVAKPKNVLSLMLDELPTRITLLPVGMVGGVFGCVRLSELECGEVGAMKHTKTKNAIKGTPAQFDFQGTKQENEVWVESLKNMDIVANLVHEEFSTRGECTQKRLWYSSSYGGRLYLMAGNRTKYKTGKMAEFLGELDPFGSLQHDTAQHDRDTIRDPLLREMWRAGLLDGAESGKMFDEAEKQGKGTRSAAGAGGGGSATSSRPAVGAAPGPPVGAAPGPLVGAASGPPVGAASSSAPLSSSSAIAAANSSPAAPSSSSAIAAAHISLADGRGGGSRSSSALSERYPHLYSAGRFVPNQDFKTEQELLEFEDEMSPRTTHEILNSFKTGVSGPSAKKKRVGPVSASERAAVAQVINTSRGAPGNRQDPWWSATDMVVNQNGATQTGRDLEWSSESLLRVYDVSIGAELVVGGSAAAASAPAAPSAAASSSAAMAASAVSSAAPSSSAAMAPAASTGAPSSAASPKLQLESVQTSTGCNTSGKHVATSGGLHELLSFLRKHPKYLPVFKFRARTSDDSGGDPVVVVGPFSWYLSDVRKALQILHNENVSSAPQVQVRTPTKSVASNLLRGLGPYGEQVNYSAQYKHLRRGNGPATVAEPGPGNPLVPGPWLTLDEHEQEFEWFRKQENLVHSGGGSSSWDHAAGADDADLQRALQASLKDRGDLSEHQKMPSGPSGVAISGPSGLGLSAGIMGEEEQDHDLQRALQISLEDSRDASLAGGQTIGSGSAVGAASRSGREDVDVIDLSDSEESSNGRSLAIQRAESLASER